MSHELLYSRIIPEAAEPGNAKMAPRARSGAGGILSALPSEFVLRSTTPAGECDPEGKT